MNFSLARICWIAFLVLEVTLSIVILAIYRDSAARQHGEPPAANRGVLTVQARLLELTGNLRSAAAHIAAHPKTLESFTRNSSPERAAQLANIRAFYPDAEVQFLSANGDAVDAPGGSFLAAGQARLLETIGKHPGRVWAAAAHPAVVAVQPVRDGGQTRGFVVMAKELPELREILQAVPARDAYIEVQQRDAGGAYSVLAQHGDESLKLAAPADMFDPPGTAWRLAVWPAAGASQPGWNYLLAWIIASLFAAVLIRALYASLRRALHNDLRAILTLFGDVRHNRLRKTYPLRLRETQQTFGLMYELGKLMVGKQKEVASFASLDHLSQVHNRRSFEARQQELFKTLAQGWAHSLLILDIDNFKQVNDTFGHDAGDALIVQFGKALRDNLRSSDFIARLGGDEFCVIFPNTPLKRAAELAARLRSNMPQELELTRGVRRQLSWSGGLSEYHRADASENMALSRADAALLDAKRAGRNRTSLKAAA